MTSLHLSSPLGLVALAALVPLAAALLLVRRRQVRAARSIGLVPEGVGAAAAFAAVLLGSAALLALAAARPFLAVDRDLRARTDAETYLVVDTSVSMLASPGPSEPPRIDDAWRFAGDLLHRLPGDAPVGIASMPQTVLPLLAPTVDRRVAREVVAGGLEPGVLRSRPPAWGIPLAPAGRPTSGGATLATNLDALATLAIAPFFRDEASRRLAVVLTDAETGDFRDAPLVRLLRGRGIHLLLVRFGSATDRIWTSVRGRRVLDRGYAPTLAYLQRVTALGGRLGGDRVYGAGDAGEVAERARALLGEGPSRIVGQRPTRVDVTAYVALAAAPLLAFALAPLAPRLPIPASAGGAERGRPSTRPRGQAR